MVVIYIKCSQRKKALLEKRREELEKQEGELREKMEMNRIENEKDQRMKKVMMDNNINNMANIKGRGVGGLYNKGDDMD